jgi:hypothetical protein
MYRFAPNLPQGQDSMDMIDICDSESCKQIAITPLERTHHSSCGRFQQSVSKKTGISQSKGKLCILNFQKLSNFVHCLEQFDHGALPNRWTLLRALTVAMGLRWSQVSALDKTLMAQGKYG